MYLPNVSQDSCGRVEDNLIFSFNRHGRSPREDFQGSFTPWHRPGRLGATKVEQPGLAKARPASTGAVVVYLEGGRTAPFVRRILAPAVNEKPGRVSFVLVPAGIPLDFS